MIFAWIRRVQLRRRRRRAALAFNRVFTFRGDRRGEWMCPTCGGIHREHSLNKFTGPQFAACCAFPAGGRLGKPYATLS